MRRGSHPKVQARRAGQTVFAATLPPSSVLWAPEVSPALVALRAWRPRRAAQSAAHESGSAGDTGRQTPRIQTPRHEAARNGPSTATHTGAGGVLLPTRVPTLTRPRSRSAIAKPLPRNAQCDAPSNFWGGRRWFRHPPLHEHRPQSTAGIHVSWTSPWWARHFPLNGRLISDWGLIAAKRRLLLDSDIAVTVLKSGFFFGP
jgi:hypothetical protein